ncbi:MAG TPA: GNAT family N-acetyltransferase [Marmoricola sp.]|jgi:GNAT superfamily N-acetyltransferase|nr:GNAT family N-acetyltransferase [Marmoricola sp.]
MDLPLGWQTDLEVLRQGGSDITEHGDHIVVRTPANPTYYWGNFVLVTDPATVDEAARWLAEFERQFPEAEHRAIGLTAEPDRQIWLDQTLFLETADVLRSSTPIEPTTLAPGYEVRRIASAADWERSTAMRSASFTGQEEFEARVTASRIAMDAEAAHAPWFGAFAGEDLAAELGITVFDSGVARYRSVVTHPDHRRRGLARHLLAVAAASARDHGAQELVIIADGGSDAGRLYQRAGFEVDSAAYQVSRVPGVIPAD